MSRYETDYGPDTPEETMLFEELHALQESYRRAAAPIVARLARIRALKCPRIVVFPDQQPAHRQVQVDFFPWDDAGSGP